MLTKEQWKAWYDYRVQFTKDTTGRDEEESYLKIFADIFDITTYDDDMDEYFGQKILTVLLSIVNKTHCDYHVERQDYIDYLMVCQFKGVYPLLEWGTSIRTAWIDPPDKGWDLNDVLGDYCGAPAGPVLRTRAEIESFILITAELIVEQVAEVHRNAADAIAASTTTEVSWIARMAPTIDMPLPSLTEVYSDDQRVLHHTHLAALTAEVNKVLGVTLGNTHVSSIEQLDLLIRDTVTTMLGANDGSTLTTGATATVAMKRGDQKIAWQIILEAHGLTAEIIID
ncbi:hypothetical protein D3C81_467180 [compost metagenome]